MDLGQEGTTSCECETEYPLQRQLLIRREQGVGTEEPKIENGERENLQGDGEDKTKAGNEGNEESSQRRRKKSISRRTDDHKDRGRKRTDREYIQC